MELIIDPADSVLCRSRWLAGECPCCGGEICEHYDGTLPGPLGEGVMICGRCIANRHIVNAEFALAMLAAILPTRD